MSVQAANGGAHEPPSIGHNKNNSALHQRESHNMSRLQNLASEIASNMSGSANEGSYI